MSSYLDVREPNHQLSSAGLVLAFVSDPDVVESRCCPVGAEMHCRVGVQCSYYFQVVGTLRAARDFALLFFFKVQLLIVFFLRTILFPSSLAILIIFISRICLMPSTALNIYESNFDVF